MGIDYPEVAKRLMKTITDFRRAQPETMKAFGELGGVTYRDGALDTKTKELIALGIAVAGRCEGCIAFHTRGAFERGATREEVAEAITVAIQMGGGPSMVYGAEALKAFDQFAALKAA